MTTRRTILQCLALPALLAAAGICSAREWPQERPITLLVPAQPGGGTDILARTFADRLGKALKQTVLVENKSGANGLIAQTSVAKAPGDGYTLVFTYAAAVVVNPSLQAKMPYDTMKDLRPIAQVGAVGNYLVVSQDVPVSDLKSFVTYMKANPDKFSYGSWGLGSGGHLTMEALKSQTGLKLSHVPYRGTAPVLNDLVGGNIKVAFVDTAASPPHLKSGKIKAVAISGTARAPQTPEVPTMTEQGYPFNLVSWYGVFAPGTTPDPIVTRLNSEINKILASPEMEERFTQLNIGRASTKSADAFKQTVQDDMKAWGEIIRANNITLQ